MSAEVFAAIAAVTAGSYLRDVLAKERKDIASELDARSFSRFKA